MRKHQNKKRLWRHNCAKDCLGEFSNRKIQGRFLKIPSHPKQSVQHQDHPSLECEIHFSRSLCPLFHIKSSTGFCFDILKLYISATFLKLPSIIQYNDILKKQRGESPHPSTLFPSLRFPGPPTLPVTRSQRTWKYQVRWGRPTGRGQCGHFCWSKSSCGNWIGTNMLSKDFTKVIQ